MKIMDLNELNKYNMSCVSVSWGVITNYHKLSGKEKTTTETYFLTVLEFRGLPWWLRIQAKESTCNAGNLGLIPGLGRCPGEGHGNPIQYSGLENPYGRVAWQATDRGVAKN